jgi:uncharacterized protein YndB with AHSA1/START domain
LKQNSQKKKSILVSRIFNAPIEKVWEAHTNNKMLDQWRGRLSPRKAETIKIDFKAGGYWFYAMVSPENQKHWGRMKYLSIDPNKS